MRVRPSSRVSAIRMANIRTGRRGPTTEPTQLGLQEAVASPRSRGHKPPAGQVAEWLKAHAWNACIGASLSRVRIPLCPPDVSTAIALIAASEDLATLANMA